MELSVSRQGLTQPLTDFGSLKGICRPCQETPMHASRARRTGARRHVRHALRPGVPKALETPSSYPSRTTAGATCPIPDVELPAKLRRKRVIDQCTRSARAGLFRSCAALRYGMARSAGKSGRRRLWPRDRTEPPRWMTALSACPASRSAGRSHDAAPPGCAGAWPASDRGHRGRVRLGGADRDTPARHPAGHRGRGQLPLAHRLVHRHLRRLRDRPGRGRHRDALVGVR